MSFFGELRRRNVFRMGIAYLAAVWVLIEVTDTLVAIINGPAWIPQALVFSAALGFPLALVLAWFYEWTSEGIKAASEFEAPEPVRFMGRKLDFAIIGLLVLAVGFLLVRSPLDNQAGVLPNSVAVLPFENLSPNPDDAYFAAGLHDEILNQISKLRNLSVISRTSVLRYADSELLVPEIARELNVATVMEGTVRYASDRVRITTQLIDAATDEHLWSETYEREFSDIFAIESDIAMSIANALEAEFSPEEQESLETVPTDSPAAYSFYLRAISGLGDSSFDSDINRAIELDPNFALAYATKSYGAVYEVLGIYGTNPGAAEEAERSVQDNAERALDLDPTLGTGHAALAALHTAHWRGVEAEEAFRRAVQLSPNNADVLLEYGRFKRYRGESEEAIRLHRRSADLDPNNPLRHFHLGVSYRYSRNYDASVAAFRRHLELSPTSVPGLLGLARSQAALGNRAEAMRAVSQAESLTEEMGLDAFRLSQLAVVYAQLDRADDVLGLLDDLEEMDAQAPVGDARWAQVYLALGDAEHAFQRLESAVEARVPTDVPTLSDMADNSLGNPILDRPAFRELLDGLWDSE